MNYYLARTMVILLFFMAPACSLPWQNRSPKTEDKLPAKSTDEMFDLTPESKMFVPGKGTSQPSSRLRLESENNQVRDPQSLLDEALEFFQRSQDFWRKGDFKNAITALDQADRLI